LLKIGKSSWSIVDYKTFSIPGSVFIVSPIGRKLVYSNGSLYYVVTVKNTSSDEMDIWVVRVNASNLSVLWSKKWNFTVNDYGSAIAVSGYRVLIAGNSTQAYGSVSDIVYNTVASSYTILTWSPTLEYSSSPPLTTLDYSIVDVDLVQSGSSVIVFSLDVNGIPIAIPELPYPQLYNLLVAIAMLLYILYIRRKLAVNNKGYLEHML